MQNTYRRRVGILLLFFADRGRTRRERAGPGGKSRGKRAGPGGNPETGGVDTETIMNIHLPGMKPIPAEKRRNRT